MMIEGKKKRTDEAGEQARKDLAEDKKDARSHLKLRSDAVDKNLTKEDKEWAGETQRTLENNDSWGTHLRRKRLQRAGRARADQVFGREHVRVVLKSRRTA
ncbi:hypothetical protein FQN54_006232 [Arachnomyces sp. PD_36]|nr:hypothetical protein FQN54_006232 [Arachnomyces sp. PD_36]